MLRGTFLVILKDWIAFHLKMIKREKIKPSQITPRASVRQPAGTDPCPFAQLPVLTDEGSRQWGWSLSQKWFRNHTFRFGVNYESVLWPSLGPLPSPWLHGLGQVPEPDKLHHAKLPVVTSGPGSSRSERILICIVRSELMNLPWDRCPFKVSWCFYLSSNPTEGKNSALCKALGCGNINNIFFYCFMGQY